MNCSHPEVELQVSEEQRLITPPTGRFWCYHCFEHLPEPPEDHRHVTNIPHRKPSHCDHHWRYTSKVGENLGRCFCCNALFAVPEGTTLRVFGKS